MVGVDRREEIRKTPLVCSKSQDDRGERWICGVSLCLCMALAGGRNSRKFLSAYERGESGAILELTGACGLRHDFLTAGRSVCGSRWDGGRPGGVQRAKRQPDTAAVYVGDGCAARCCRREWGWGVRGLGLELCVESWNRWPPEPLEMKRGLSAR